MHGLKVAFTDPAMGQMRRETAEHKEMEKAFQAEVYSQKGTQLREGSKSPSVAPQRSEKRPQGRSNDLI
jgi:competence protein ComGF